MAITYFQDTIFSTESTLSAPATGTALQVAVNNLFSTKDYTFVVTVASVDTNVIVCLEGSVDGTNYAPIIANQTITANGTTVYRFLGNLRDLTLVDDLREELQLVWLVKEVCLVLPLTRKMLLMELVVDLYLKMTQLGKLNRTAP